MKGIVQRAAENADSSAEHDTEWPAGQPGDGADRRKGDESMPTGVRSVGAADRARLRGVVPGELGLRWGHRRAQMLRSRRGGRGW